MSTEQYWADVQAMLQEPLLWVFAVSLQVATWVGGGAYVLRFIKSRTRKRDK